MSDLTSQATSLQGESRSPDTSGPPYRWALGTGVLVFFLYALTLAPTTAFWDTSEYIATAHILGIPHPPGNPLFVVMARAWELLLAPLGLSVAVRINLFSAFVSAAAHGLWFLVVHHVLRFFSDDRYFRLAGALAAVLVSATAFTVWNQSNVNEKVYTVSLLTIALLSWLAFRWQENLGKGRDDNILVLMAFILALSVGNHLMAFLAAPAIGFFILMVRPRVLMNWKLYPAVLVAAVLGLSIHLFLPLRAGLAPIINEASPTCEGLQSALTSIITYGKAGCVALSESLTRQQYLKPPLLPRQAPLSAQFFNYLQYFDWQWARGVQGENVLLANLRIPFTMLFTGLGVWGALEHYRRDKPSFVYMLTLFGTVSVALIFYLNFKYGFSIPDPTANVDLHEVRERDYFFIVSFSVWGLWAGVGIAAIWQWLARDVVGGLLKASPALLLALLPLLGNWSRATRDYDYAARDWAHNLLMSVEPYGVLFTNGDNDTFPLWYLQEVEGLRRDVTVIVTSYLNTPWYTKQLSQITRPCPPGVSADQDPTRILCQREYRPDDLAEYTTDPASAEAAGRVPLLLHEPVQSPTRAILELEASEIDQMAEQYVPIDQAQAVPLGNITALLEEGQVLYPWQTFALLVLRTALGDRPVYFASSGNAAASIGVGSYLVRQGLAFKLNNGPLPDTASEGVIAMSSGSSLLAVTGRYVDVPRTRTLIEDVFVHRSELPFWSHWPDRSTIGIPNYYAWAYYALAQAALQAGDSTDVGRFRDAGDAWGILGN